MTGTRPVWLAREVVGVPEDAQVVHVEGRALAVVAVPTWTVWVLSPLGAVEAPEDRNAKLLAQYFPHLSASSTEKIR